jgi:hypothetical protein
VTTASFAFGPVLAQYVSEQSASRDSFQISRNYSHRDPNRDETVLQEDISRTAGPTHTSQDSDQNLLSSGALANKSPSQSSSQASPSGNFESVLLHARLASRPCLSTEPCSRRGGLDRLERNSVAERRSQPYATESPSSPVGSATPSPLRLTELEVVIFRNFVERVARWVCSQTIICLAAVRSHREIGPLTLYLIDRSIFVGKAVVHCCSRASTSMSSGAILVPRHFSQATSFDGRGG